MDNCSISEMCALIRLLSVVMQFAFENECAMCSNEHCKTFQLYQYSKKCYKSHYDIFGTLILFYYCVWSIELCHQTTCATWEIEYEAILSPSELSVYYFPIFL